MSLGSLGGAKMAEDLNLESNWEIRELHIARTYQTSQKAEQNALCSREHQNITKYGHKILGGRALYVIRRSKGNIELSYLRP